ncbi:MAG: hypothetical protein Q9160_004044 [Pyrenula sp. 1 TL-2023]
MVYYGAAYWNFSLIILKFAKVITYFHEVLGNAGGSWFQDPDTRPLVVEAGGLLYKCKVLAREMKSERPTRRLSHPGLDPVPPSRTTADTMVQLYFQYYESTHRILHVPTFWIDYERYWENPESAPMGLRFIILLVIAIGSSLFEHIDQEGEFRSMVHRWVYAAQTWLSGPLEKDRLNVTGLQVHCLTILARQIFCLGSDLVWSSTGSLIHRAMQIALHRDPKHLPPMTVSQAEVRRRLWATILEIAVQSSLDSDMPPRISFDEFDTESPSNVNDDEIDESTAVLQPHSRDEFTMTLTQLILLDSLRIRHQIVKLLNGLSTDISYADVLTLTSNLNKALGSCSILKPERRNPAMIPFHRNLLDYLVRRFLLHVHIPFSCRAHSNPLFHYSRKVSLDAAIAMISPEPDEAFSRLVVIGGGMFKSGIRYAGVAVSLELLAQTEAQYTDMTLHRNSEYRAVLQRAVQKTISLSAERIQHGESNVKMHVFLNMVIAEAEAMEAGSTSCNFEIARSARDSLQLCHDMLQLQMGSVPLLWDNEMGDLPNFDGERGAYTPDFDIGNFLEDASIF